MDDFYIKIELRRTSPKYDHVPVDVVCKKHINGLTEHHPIQPLTNHDKYTTHGAARLYKLGLIQKKNFEEKIAISFPCQDSCIRGKD